MQSALRCSNLGESSARITLHLLELNRSGKSLPGNALAQRLLDDNSTRSLPSGSAPPELTSVSEKKRAFCQETLSIVAFQDFK